MLHKLFGFVPSFSMFSDVPNCAALACGDGEVGISGEGLEEKFQDLFDVFERFNVQVQ